LNILLRDNGLEEEDLVPWEGEFICCVCATTAAAVSITLLNVLLPLLLLLQTEWLLQMQIVLSLE
jgi:hypothetical protein